MSDIKELFKHVSALLDTDLHVKLLRSSKFEDFAKLMLTIILITVIIIGCVTSVTLIKSFITKSNSQSKCTLTLDNSTWNTIYVASHVTPPSSMPVT